VSGRFLIAALVGAMLLIPFTPLAKLLERKDPQPATHAGDWKVGGRGRVNITVITADYNLLSCSSDKAIEGKHCANKSENEPWPRDPSEPLDDNKKNQIQPYRTWPDNKLILVAGLWAEPTVAMRLHNEPPGAVPQKKLARFIVGCDMKFIGRLDAPKLRWGPGGPWQNEGAAIVAEPITCEIAQGD
jgi:hypothetical protein